MFSALNLWANKEERGLIGHSTVKIYHPELHKQKGIDTKQQKISKTSKNETTDYTEHFPLPNR